MTPATSLESPLEMGGRCGFWLHTLDNIAFEQSVGSVTEVPPAGIEEIARAGNDPSVALRKESVWADACCAGHRTGNGADRAAEFVRAPSDGH